jgi:mono/diheme cytochrome c family protein
MAQCAASALLLLVLLFIAAGARAQQPSLLERGSYLVNGIMTCNHCHTPKEKPGGDPVMARQLSGGSQRFDEIPFTVTGPNITPENETGVGAWSDAELKRALTEGVRPNGVRLAIVMPYPLYRVLTPRDLDAVVAYVRSVAPIRNQVEGPVYKMEQVVYTFPGAEKPMSEADLRDPVKRGLYLASLAHCMHCHAERADDVPNYRTGAGKGGRMFKTPAGMVKAANITSHPIAGIGSWSDAELKRALTEGISRDGRPLAVTMAQYKVYFSRLTDEDLSALVAWMRSLPPLE